MAELEGGCRVPLGVICLSGGGRRTLHLKVYTPDGARSLVGRTEVDERDPRGSGIRAARDLLAAGAAEILRAGSPTSTEVSEQ